MRGTRRKLNFRAAEDQGRPLSATPVAVVARGLQRLFLFRLWKELCCRPTLLLNGRGSDTRTRLKSVSKEVKTLKDPYDEDAEAEEEDWDGEDVYWSFLDQALALMILNFEWKQFLRN